MTESTPRPTAAERATEFATKAYSTFKKVEGEYQDVFARYEDARLELQWAMAHPALPEGFDPSQAGGTPAEPEKPAPKRRGRPPRKAAEATPAPEAAAPVQEAAPAAQPVMPAPAPPAPVPAPQAAPEPVAAPVATFAPPAAASAPSGDFFDPFAGSN